LEAEIVIVHHDQLWKVIGRGGGASLRMLLHKKTLKINLIKANSKKKNLKKLTPKPSVSENVFARFIRRKVTPVRITGFC